MTRSTPRQQFAPHGSTIMVRTLPFPPDRPDPVPVHALVPVERLCVDAEAVPRLTAALGAPAATDLVIRLRDDLEHRLPMIIRLWSDGSVGPMADVARGLPGPARALGLGDLARSAADLVACAGRNDPAAQSALAAVAARLARLAHLSLVHLDASRKRGYLI